MTCIMHDVNLRGGVRSSCTHVNQNVSISYTDMLLPQTDRNCRRKTKQLNNLSRFYFQNYTYKKLLLFVL